jgi:hypothetical protein
MSPCANKLMFEIKADIGTTKVSNYNNDKNNNNNKKKKS